MRRNLGIKKAASEDTRPALAIPNHTYGGCWARLKYNSMPNLHLQLPARLCCYHGCWVIQIFGCERKWVSWGRWSHRPKINWAPNPWWQQDLLGTTITSPAWKPPVFPLPASLKSTKYVSCVPRAYEGSSMQFIPESWQISHPIFNYIPNALQL